MSEAAGYIVGDRCEPTYRRSPAARLTPICPNWIKQSAPLKGIVVSRITGKHIRKKTSIRLVGRWLVKMELCTYVFSFRRISIFFAIYSFFADTLLYCRVYREIERIRERFI